MNFTKSLAFSALLFSCVCHAQVRKEVRLNDNWRFSMNDGPWTQVSVPHDWAIAGPFDKKWDLQVVAIEQNGEKQKTEHSGRSGALPWIGKGVYRKLFNVPHQYKHAELKFDGAMSEPEVYVNGQRAGGWAYGYNAFRVDVTPFLKSNTPYNTLEVRLQNVGESSRWYPGGGLYRPVTLVLTDEARIDRWGTFVRTDSLTNAQAWMEADFQVLGAQHLSQPVLEMTMMDRKGRKVASSHWPLEAHGKVHHNFCVAHPQLWTPESPSLYRMVIRLYDGKRLVDETVEKTGIRTVAVSAEHGFQLNGISRKFKGVCLHHDLGPLGAAVNRAAIERQVRIMKDMGCDAIRTAHNMPSSLQMEVCDSMGMMVMAESFDMWLYPKCANGYARFFNEWSDKDITNLILNHRNHPSVVMWSIGNEIPEQGDVKKGIAILKRLQNICHQLDPTRPVTQGMDRVDNVVTNGFGAAMDVPGLNYRTHKYDKAYQMLPQKFVLGSETASTVSSRGVYKFPVKKYNIKMYDDGQCSSYDVEYCPWSNLPDEDFALQEDKPWTIGQFVWTGFDYLGEPTPYDGYWPSRSSYFGICDLAGLPKDRFYLYRSVWNNEQHTIHLLPHWTWPDRVGQVTPVYCYTDYDEAELFVNGKSQGRISKNKDSFLDRYRLRWNEVVYEPGELKVVVYDAAHKPAGQQVIRTAGAPHHLLLTPDKTLLKADGTDLVYVTVNMVDKDGNLCPNADDELEFAVSGTGSFEAVCNGDATSLESFKQPMMRLFNGQLVVTLRSAKKAGKMTLRVKGNGMEQQCSVRVK